MDQEMISHFDEGVRELRKELASLRGDIRFLAEVFLSVRLSLEHLQEEVTLQFEAVQELLRPVQAQLDGRIRSLETWRETKERDPIDIIRERYGKKPEQ